MSRILARHCFQIVLCALVATANGAHAVQVLPGYIVSPQNDNNSGTTLVIDPTTGNREILSRYPDIGAGPRMRSPTSIVQLPDRDFLVSEAFTTQGIFRIDRITGDRTFISGVGLGIQGDPTSVGTGPIDNPISVLLRPNDIFVVNAGGTNYTSGFITKVDAVTGNRTLVSGLGVGSGPNFPYLQRGEFAADGRLLVTADNLIFAVNTATGARSVFSGAGVGTGPAFSQPYDVVALPDGDLIVADVNFSAVPFRTSLFKVDGDTGNRTLITQHLTNDQDFDYQSLALGTDGMLLSSAASQKIFRINPLSGSQVLVSGATRGTGPAILNWGDMVVVVPEPSTCTLVFLLAVALSSCRLRTASNKGGRAIS